MKNFYKKKLNSIFRIKNKISLKGVIGIGLCVLFIHDLTVIRAQKPGISISNYIRLGKGDEEFFGMENEKEYLEQEFNLQLTWKNFIVGSRYEYEHPAEFGISHNKLRKYYLEYRKGPWRVRTGTFSSLFSRGLVLNSYEEKPIGHDSEISGINIKYESEESLINLIAGSYNYERIPYSRDVIKYAPRGGLLQRKISENIHLGGSFVWANISQDVGYNRESFDTYLAEIWCDLQIRSLQLYGNIASKSQSGKNLFFKDKNSVYIGVNYSNETSGLAMEYKSYRFGLVSPEKREFELRHNRFLSFQNPPIALKEHSWIFLSRSLHIVDFNDEVGLQLDFYHSLASQTILNLNGGIASRHYNYLKTTSGEFIRRDDHFSWIPSLDNSFSPFWNIYAEVEHYLMNGSSITGGISYVFETIYNDFFPEISEQRRMFVLPLRINYLISSVYTLLLSSEYQRFSESIHPGKYFNNQILSLGFSKAPNWSFGINTEFLSKGADISGKTSWVSGSIQYRFRSRQIFEITYGNERGGLICTNGLCRFVPAFKGWRFNITTQL